MGPLFYIGSANLSNPISRRTSATVERLNEHKALIEIATEDLSDHLESIDEKLEMIFKQTVTEVGPDSVRLQAMKEEKLSAQRSLQIGGQLQNISIKSDPLQTTMKASPRALSMKVCIIAETTLL